MRRHGAVTAAVMAISLALGGIALADKEKALLDGKSFDGKMAERDKPDKAEADSLVFNDGKFRSTACDPYGFVEAPYTAKQSGDAIAFEATATSPKEGKIVWKGTVKGDAVDASAMWSKAGQRDIAYTFKGTLKK